MCKTIRTMVLVSVSILLFFCQTTWSANGNRLFIVDGSDGSVYFTDISNLKNVTLISAETGSAMTIAANQNTLYFVNALIISVLDRQTLKNLNSIVYDGFPTPGLIKARVAAGGKKLYFGVIGWGKEADSGLFIIDLDKNEQKMVLEKNHINSGYLDLSENQRFIYFAGNDGIKILRTQDDAVVGTIPMKSGEWVWDIACGTGDHLYASLYQYGENPVEEKYHSILFVKTTTNTQNRLPMSEKIYRLFFSKSTRRLFALGDKTLFKIDPEAMRVVGSYPMSGGDLMMTPDGSKLFVADNWGGEVLSIEPDNGKIYGRIKAGEKPYEIFIF